MGSRAIEILVRGETMTRPHPHLYEINTVPWLVDLTRRTGRRVTLGNVPDEAWDALEELGFDYVWLMGVWQRSPAGRRIAQDLESLWPQYREALPSFSRGDVVGSPYSVQFYEPDVLVGSWDDLRAARRALASRGMKLILDFVPNHTALDHDWATSHPEYYVHATAEDLERDPDAYLAVTIAGVTHYLARGKDPHFPAWTDTLQVDYFYDAARAAMLAELARISAFCDGVRCDMAMLVLGDVFARTWGHHKKCNAPSTEFWAEARAAVPDKVLVAEAYWGLEGRLIDLGFDYCYDKNLYDHIRSGSGKAVRRELSASADHQRRLVRFIENHDEPRAMTAFGPRWQPASVLIATLPGMRFFHEGQLEGREARIPVQLIRAREEARRDEVASHYARLLEIAGHPVFHEGSFATAAVSPYESDPSSDDLIAYAWSWGDTVRACAVNLTDRWIQGRVGWPFHIPDGPVRFTDLLSFERYERDGREARERGLHVVLRPHQSHVFEIAGL